MEYVRHTNTHTLTYTHTQTHTKTHTQRHAHSVAGVADTTGTTVLLINRKHCSSLQAFKLIGKCDTLTIHIQRQNKLKRMRGSRVSRPIREQDPGDWRKRIRKNSQTKRGVSSNVLFLLLVLAESHLQSSKQQRKLELLRREPAPAAIW